MAGKKNAGKNCLNMFLGIILSIINVSRRHTQSKLSINDKKSTSDNFENNPSTLYETIFKE